MENKKPFFSIVMPIYNVERHLHKAIDSLLQQTFQDYEIILVDDCSTDKCPGICNKYAKKYNCIQVVHHKENQGLSYARNTGMSIATGKYIWFMDSDDYVDTDLLEKVYSSLQQNLAEIVVIGLIEEYYDSNDELHHTEIVCHEEKVLSTQEAVRSEIMSLEKETLYGYAWNKFYSLEYLRKIGIKFEKITLIEDILFNVQYCMHIQSMNILNLPAYHYNKRMDNSLTAKFVPDYYELHQRRIELLYEQQKYWGICTNKTKSILATLYTRYIFSALQRNCDKRAKMHHDDRVRWMQNVMQKDIYKALIPYGKSQSKVVKVMLHLLKRERKRSCVVLGRIIYIVKNKLPMFFAKVKQKR